MTLRKKDTSNVDMIKTEDLRRALERYGAATTRKEWERLKAPLKISATSECDYRQLLSFIFDHKTVDALMSMPIKSNTQKESKPVPKVEFVLPKRPSGAKSAGLDSIA